MAGIPTYWRAPKAPCHHPASGGATADLPDSGSGVRQRIAEPFAETDAMLSKGSVRVDGKLYPDGNPKTVFGTAKPSLFMIPPSALIYLGTVMSNGAAKYGPLNWRGDGVTVSTYYDAAFRHLLEYRDGGDLDTDSRCKILAHTMACCAILLDAELQGTLNDDRGHPGNVRGLIDSLTKKS